MSTYAYRIFVTQTKETTKQEKRPNMEYRRDYNEEYRGDYYDEFDDCYASSYGAYVGTYAQDVMGYSDEFIDDVLGGDPDAYWNID